MAVNKVVYGGETLVDLTGDTVTPETMVAGTTAHNAAGVAVTGVLSMIPEDGSVTTKKIANANVTKEKIAAGATYTDLTVTLAAASWSNNSITVTANGVTATNVVVVSPNPANHDEYCESGVKCTAQATNKLTFTCNEKPTVDLVVNVLIPQ